jgi:hypothetical protein
MKNVFVFCASAPKARANFLTTVAAEVPADNVLPSFPAERHEELLSWRSVAGGFYLWGIKSSKRVLTMLSKLHEGDYVLGFFDFRYQSVARLVGRAKSPDLAAKLWGSMEWDEIMFMEKPMLVSVKAEKLQPFLCSTYRGATRISSDRVGKIIQEFGSLESFFSIHFKNSDERRSE